MIEIRSRWDNRVLYTAENATDVRVAVKEAVASGADLTGADLTGADLTRADLTRADLTGAYLTGANLTGAHLARAYLAGADLAGANLTRADLTGAYLTGANLTGAHLARAYLTGANLTGAHLARAYLTGANLTGANLTRADLARANLTGAYLTGAYLTGANLTGAHLAGAHLTGVIGVNKYQLTPLHILRDQPGPIRAYKLVTGGYQSPIHPTGRITYTIDETITAPTANTNENDNCGAGINLATLDWCIREYRAGYRILVVEFTAADIAAIPTGSDGKFRVHRCTVVGEKDLTELGVTTADTEAAS